jgi:two-component system KDP operon response regulator KdpE
MADEGPRILVVEDEQEMRRYLCVSLQLSGYRVLEAQTAGEVNPRAATSRPDLILLDLELPDGDGLDVILQIREWSQLPIIVLSGRGRESDKVQALDRGADDYLTKPFNTQELLARIRVALRHASQRRHDGIDFGFQVGELRVDLVHRNVIVRGQRVHFTPIEFRLLSMLVQHADQIVTHRQFLEEVWGPSCVDERHYVRVVMAALRRKIEVDSSQPQYLLTEPGIGYRLIGESLLQSQRGTTPIQD